MEDIRLIKGTASFTVEAVFIMSITIWVIFSICYLSIYAHDRTAIYSLGEGFLEEVVENGKEWEDKDTFRFRKYLEEHLIILKIKEVSVRKKVLSVEADILFYVDIHVPFIQKMLTGEDGKQIYLSHERIFPPYYMWDGEVIRGVLK